MGILPRTPGQQGVRGCDCEHHGAGLLYLHGVLCGGRLLAGLHPRSERLGAATRRQSGTGSTYGHTSDHGRTGLTASYLVTLVQRGDDSKQDG